MLFESSVDNITEEENEVFMNKMCQYFSVTGK